MKKLRIILPFVVVLGGLGYFILARRDAGCQETPFNHFKDEGRLIRLLIETDMERLLSEKEVYEYQPIRLTLQKERCPDEFFQMEAKPRGVFRKANCAFPPLKLRFPDEVLAAGGFRDYSTLKLVTHCQEDPFFDQLIIKECLTFQLYNVITSNSFRTQLARIIYRDEKGRYPEVERFGFLIEPPGELAERMNGIELEEEYGTPRNINLPAYQLFAVFQYMIGNTDWGLKNRHNVKLIQPREGDVKWPVPVPYDFDFCGLVDAPYAIPHHLLPIKEVKERHFQWIGGEADFTEAFALFQEKKGDLISVFENCPFLDEQEKQESIAFLQSFFEELQHPEQITAGVTGN